MKTHAAAQDRDASTRPVCDFVANCSLLYAHLDPLERASAAVADGYRKVEFWWPFDSSIPADHEVATFIDSAQTSGAQVVAMNFTLGGPGNGGRGIASHPACSDEFADHVEAVAGIVETLGITRCNIPYGVRLSRVTDDEQRNTAVQNLAFASDRLASLGAVPMLEPISGAGDYPIVTSAQAVDVIKQVETVTGRYGALGLLADLYHLAVNDENIEAVLRRYVGHIVHVQVADHPGRHEPGTGRLAINRYLEILHSLGYRGDVAMEYIPSRPARRGVGPNA